MKKLFATSLTLVLLSVSFVLSVQAFDIGGVKIKSKPSTSSGQTDRSGEYEQAAGLSKASPATTSAPTVPSSSAGTGWMNGEGEAKAHSRVYADVSTWHGKPISEGVAHFEALYGPSTTQVLQNGSGDKWHLWHLPVSERIHYILGLMDKGGTVSYGKCDRATGR